MERAFAPEVKPVAWCLELASGRALLQAMVFVFSEPVGRNPEAPAQKRAEDQGELFAELTAVEQTVHRPHGAKWGDHLPNWSCCRKASGPRRSGLALGMVA